MTAPTIELPELRRLLPDPPATPGGAADTSDRRPDRGPRTRVVMALGSHRYALAHIPGTETFDDVETALAALAPDEPIVLYCTGGTHVASLWAYRVLRSRGYGRVRVFRGGLEAWSDAGLPLGGAMGSDPTTTSTEVTR